MGPVRPRLKCKRSVNKVKIEIFEPESVQTCLKGRFDAFGPMIGVPQLCGNENIFARDPCSGKSCLQRLAYLALISVSLCTIEVSKSGRERISGRGSGLGWVGNQGPQPSAGIWPLPLLSAILVSRRSEDPVMGTPPRYFVSKPAKCD